ncbi:MAG TPA: chromosome segregation protein SMC, partial [Plasticicumulans sp.]|nr:chromosome segregation protein SMC [Plasticicumulans sp.]
EALCVASTRTQIIVTSHSPELLDDPDLPAGSLYAVVNEAGESKIAPIDPASRQALTEHLFTAGELLRMNQLAPDPDAMTSRIDQMELFGERCE